MEPRIQYTTTSDGVSIARAEAGQGRAALWCGGTPWTHVQELFAMWGASFEAFFRLFRMVYFDARGAGEPIEEDGDLFGATVILASRIAAKAAGGEILVADTVRGLCSGKGFLFADRGEFVAKGFEEPVRVYEVRWRE